MRVGLLIGLIWCGLAAMLASCSELNGLQRQYGDRWGPDPTMPASDFRGILEQQHEVMKTIIASVDQNDHIAASDSGYWPAVTARGMNVVDQKCDLYMSDMFKLNRQHDRNDTVLKSIDSAAEAIVGVTTAANAARLPLLAIGQSFGLVESINDAAAKTYLFEQIPGIVADKVKTARNLYRNTIETTARASLKDEASAYRAIRDYLNLCMPETIEGNFLSTYISSSNTLAGAGAPQPAPAQVSAARAPTAVTNLNFTVKPHNP